MEVLLMINRDAGVSGMFAGAGWNRGDKPTGRVATSKNRG